MAKLLDVLHELVESGNSVVVIEHNLEVIKTADWIIDLGPEGGDGGGEIVAVGPPEDVVKEKRSYTGAFLKPVLARGGPEAEAGRGGGVVAKGPRTIVSRKQPWLWPHPPTFNRGFAFFVCDFDPRLIHHKRRITSALDALSCRFYDLKFVSTKLHSRRH